MFLPNSHSFLLVSPVISRPVIQSGIQEFATSLPPPSSSSACPEPSRGDCPEPSRGDCPEPSQGDSDKPTIGDKDKRTFLKVAGIAGASLAGSLLLPQKADAFIMGSSPTTGVVGVKNSTNTRINPATEETVSSLLKPTDLDFDGSGYLNVNVQATAASSFSDVGGTARLALVDADRNVQVDVLSSALPTSASTEDTLETISFGGVQFALRLATVGSFDYVGEAPANTLPGTNAWRIKRVDSSDGIVVKWAGSGGFNQVWDNGAGVTYENLTYL